MRKVKEREKMNAITQGWKKDQLCVKRNLHQELQAQNSSPR